MLQVGDDSDPSEGWIRLTEQLLLTLTLADVAAARIAMPEGCAAPVAHAAHELARYVAALVSVPAPDVVIDARLPETSILLGDDAGLLEVAQTATRDLSEDGHAITIDRAGIAIAGVNPRGTLYGVYGLLHELGCRWLTPDDDGEVIPALDEIHLPLGTRRSAPAFLRRGFGEDTRAVPLHDERWFTDLVSDTRRFVDWMAKNRLSHFTTTAAPLANVPALNADLDQRGIVSSYGTGHNLPRLLPRDMYEDHPDYFRMDASGQRRPDGNLCVSNADAVRIVVANAIEDVRTNQPVEIYSIQGEDTPEGTWCACPVCRELTALQQNLLVCRAVEDGLRSAGFPDTQVALAGYQSTIEPAIDPADLPNRLFVHFAPRERSYAEPIDGLTNQTLARQLTGWASLLGDDSLANIEYYTDAIRFASLPVPLPHLIAADLRAYREAGATGWLRVLFMSRYCWWAYPLNFYVVSRLAWDTDEPVEEIIADFCHHRYGPTAATMTAFFVRFEQTMSHIVQDSELDRPPALTAPPSQQQLVVIERAIPQLADAISLAERALSESDAAARDRVRRELLAARFAANQVTALAHQLQGQHLLANTTDHSHAASELEQAIATYRAGIELLVTDPAAPRSAWLDSGLGIQHNTGAIIDKLQHMLTECERA